SVAAAILKLYADETGRSATPEQQEDDLATFSAATGAGRGPRSETGMVRLFLNVGRHQSIRPQDIVGAIANEAGIPGKAIGAIDILDSYTFVDIPHEYVDRVLAAMNRATIKGRPVNVEIAKPTEGGGDRAPRGGYERGGRPGGYPRREGGPGFDRGGRQRFDRGPGRSPYVGGVRVGGSQESGGEAGRRDGGKRQGPPGRRFERSSQPARFRPPRGRDQEG
ncbi:MAG TPA: DbpA RNA binding domain-containing protein, partial [Thermomicrobiales bacterium]|nr:DbpA RNA binding domain-containing protein [Thermomicrobiales bacterium]